MVAIDSPGNSEAEGKPTRGTNMGALSTGHIAGIIVGSIFSLVFIIFLAFVGKRKLTKRKAFRQPDHDTLSFHQKMALNMNAPELDSENREKHEIDGCMYPGTELEAKRDTQEMESNEEAAYELATPDVHISELPS